MNSKYCAQDYVNTLDSLFSKHANDGDAFQMAKYMKNKFAFYGLKKPLRAALFKSFKETLPRPPHTALDELVRILWQMPQREMQYVAMEILYEFRRHINTESIDLYAFLIKEKSWWDTVDLLAGKLVGIYFQKFPEQINSVTGAWMSSGNMWLQRSCILFQLHYKEKTNFPLLISFIEPCKTSQEFFIQKAIGWALREYAKTAPEMVWKYVTQTELKPLSKREALKHIGDIQI